MEGITRNTGGLRSLAVVAAMAVVLMRPTGGVHMAGLMSCGEGQRVSAHECVPCEPGQSNRQGDDPLGPDTPCDGSRICASHEFVQKGKCKECPAGTRYHATPGADPFAVALGLEKPCVSFDCQVPVTHPRGYDITDVNTIDLTARDLNVQGIVCDVGFAGVSPSASSCIEVASHHSTEYVLKGCEMCIAGKSFADVRGLRGCLQCHQCQHGSEIEHRGCTPTRDRVCACADGYEGNASSASSHRGGCYRASGQRAVTKPKHSKRVEVYNLGTMLYQCEVFVEQNRQDIILINQHMNSGREDTPGFNTCQHYCAHYVNRRDATLCHGMCEVAGLQQFTTAFDALKEGSKSDAEVCGDVFGTHGERH